MIHRARGRGCGAPTAAGKSLKKETKLGLSVRKAEDFATWYPEAIVAGEFISYYDVSGAPLLEVWRSVAAFHAEASKA